MHAICPSVQWRKGYKRLRWLAEDGSPVPAVTCRQRPLHRPHLLNPFILLRGSHPPTVVLDRVLCLCTVKKNDAQERADQASGTNGPHRHRLIPYCHEWFVHFCKRNSFLFVYAIRVAPGQVFEGFVHSLGLPAIGVF